MRLIPILLFIFILSLQSCGTGGQEKSLKDREDQVVLKEQELMVWERQLKLKEQEIENAREELDSAKKLSDSVSVYNPELVGKWIVKMTNTETSCEGSALGDTKTEQWEISYQDNHVVVKAFSGPVQTRVYVGRLKDNVLNIVDEKPNPDATFSATLNFIDAKRMEGTREILQKNCKIVYALNIQRFK